MAKKAKKRNSKIIWAKENKFKSLLAVLVFLFVALTLYNKVLAYQEKKEFEKARVAIEALYADIENLVGKPDKTDRISSCGYGSAKFTRGFRGCNVSINFTYKVSGPDEATRRAQAVIKETRQHFNITYSDFDIKLPFIPLESEKVVDPNGGGFLISNEAGADIATNTNSNFYIKGNRGCSLSFIYTRGDYYALPMPNDGSPEYLLVRLGCGGDARAEHYPGKD